MIPGVQNSKCLDINERKNTLYEPLTKRYKNNKEHNLIKARTVKENEKCQKEKESSKYKPRRALQNKSLQSFLKVIFVQEYRREGKEKRVLFHIPYKENWTKDWRAGLLFEINIDIQERSESCVDFLNRGKGRLGAIQENQERNH